MQVDGPYGEAHVDDVKLGQAIRQVRGDIDQRDLATAIGRDQGTISKWEQDRGRPDLEHLAAIEIVANVPRGTVLRVAGYIEDAEGDVRSAILAARELSDAQKRTLLDVYEALRSSGASTSALDLRRPRTASPRARK